MTGIGISAMLSRQGISNIIIDRKDQLGGLWTDKKVVYAGLHLHAPTYYNQYLDDEVNNASIKKQLLQLRRSAQEHLEYLHDYARRHRIIFVGGVKVDAVHTNKITLKSIESGFQKELMFDWVIDCTRTRTNSGEQKQLANTQILTEDLLKLSRDNDIAVIGGGKSGADAVLHLRKSGFTKINWICSRKYGFMNRDVMKNENFLHYQNVVHKFIFKKNLTEYPIDNLLTPHDSIDCFKFGIIDTEELSILKETTKTYGKVKKVLKVRSGYTNSNNKTSSGKKKYSIIFRDNNHIEADVVINSLGVNPKPFLKRQADLENKTHLVFKMLDFNNKVAYISNSHGEATTGASLLGLVLALVIQEKINADNFKGLHRLKLTIPYTGCMSMGINPPPADDAFLMESHILKLLGLSGEHSFRLLSEEKRRSLMNMSEHGRGYPQKLVTPKIGI